jgi:hypothetical protein
MVEDHLAGVVEVDEGPKAAKVAEREGFEPSVEGLPLLVLSRHAD